MNTETNKNSELVADFGLVKGFKSSSSNKRKNLNHFFIGITMT